MHSVAPMKRKERQPFDPKDFLAKAHKGKTLGEFGKDYPIFLQGGPADAIFYILNGRVKVTVVSHQGKEAVVAILGTGDFFGEGCLAGQSLRTSTATTISECSIVRLEKAAAVCLL